MNLCIDIGNSRIKLALFDHGVLTQFKIFQHKEQQEIQGWLKDRTFNLGIYSTVLNSTPLWLSSLNQKIIKLSVELKLPIKINYHTPELLGTDRIAAMVGAIGISSNDDLLVVNAGTCVTYDVVNRNHEFEGGNIAPGLQMRWQAMHHYTSSLPLVSEVDQNAGFLGKDTAGALQSGGLQGIVMEIEGYFGRLQDKYPDLKCILTGGTSAFLVNHLKIDNFAEPYLVLKGLNTILSYQ